MKNDTDNAYEIMECEVKREWKLIQNKGIILSTILEFTLKLNLNLGKSSIVNSGAVRVAKFMDLHLFEGCCFNRKLLKQYIDAYAGGKIDKKTMRLSFNLLEEEEPLFEGYDSINSINSGILYISYYAPEKLLIDQFRELVRARKKTIKGLTKKTFTDADLTSWSNLNVLPCIDLLIYADLHDAEIQHNKIGQLLFPDEFDVALPDRIRRSVLPKAKLLLTTETIHAMEYQLTS